MSLTLPRNFQEWVKARFREWHNAWGHVYPHEASDPGVSETDPEWIDLTDGGETPLHSHTGGGVTDHGALTGLADDDHPQYATDTDLTTHAAAADPHTVYVREADASWIDLTDSGATTLHSHTGGAALTVQEADGTPSDTAVTVIKVPNGSLTDNGVGDVTLSYDNWGHTPHGSLVLKDTAVHASNKQSVHLWSGGSKDVKFKAFAAAAVGVTQTFDVKVIRAGSVVSTTTVTITTTAPALLGALSAAVSLQNDDILYVLHTGGDTSGEILGVGIIRQ